MSELPITVAHQVLTAPFLKLRKWLPVMLRLPFWQTTPLEPPEKVLAEIVAEPDDSMATPQLSHSEFSKSTLSAFRATPVIFTKVPPTEDVVPTAETADMAGPTTWV